MAEKHPHLPVVAATAQSSDKVSTAIHVLRDSFEEGNTQMAERQEAGFISTTIRISTTRRMLTTIKMSTTKLTSSLNKAVASKTLVSWIWRSSKVCQLLSIFIRQTWCLQGFDEYLRSGYY
jgi:hypothetical protein